MDQTGAVLGPLFVAVSVARTHHFGPAFLWLAVPAAGAFVALIFARAARPDKGTPPAVPRQKDLPKSSGSMSRPPGCWRSASLIFRARLSLSQ